MKGGADVLRAGIESGSSEQIKFNCPVSALTLLDFLGSTPGM